MHKALPLEDRKVRQQRLRECVGMPAVEFNAQVPFYVCSFVWFMKYLRKLSCCHGGCCWDGLLAFKIVCSTFRRDLLLPLWEWICFRGKRRVHSKRRNRHYPAQETTFNTGNENRSRNYTRISSSLHSVSKVMRVLCYLKLYKAIRLTVAVVGCNCEPV